jgi:hypothetical protein
MPADDKMAMDERRKYLVRMQKRYREADRRTREQLLDEMQQMTELHRKSLIRRMAGNLERQPRRQQRGRTYGRAVERAVQIIAESLDYPCAERLTPNLVWMANHLVRQGELQVTPEVLAQLGEISLSTVQRLSADWRRDIPRRLPRGGPERANQVLRDVPMKRIAWNEPEPGHFEVDLVHHGGPSASGDYVHTLQMIDVCTGWSERMAVLGRSYVVMQDAFRWLSCRLPFPVLEIHPDNGDEFFNAHLVRFWKDRVQGVALSRSRPYHKNDNRFVEQKNSTLVRAYLGHDRLDTVEQTRTLNRLFHQMWIYYNLFQPVMHQVEKTIITLEDHSTRIQRRHDTARTPFERLCETGAICPQRRIEIEALRNRTNPRQLRQEIYEAIPSLFELPGAVPGQRQNVRNTLRP